MLYDDGEVLVAAEMHGAGLPDQPQRGIATRLWPAVAVEVGEQPLVGLIVHVHRAAEGGLREHRLGPHAGRVLRPAVEPGELPRAQQLEAGKIDRHAVIRRIGDVVGPGPECGDRSLGAGLELPVFEDREVEPAEHEPREIDRDPLLHRRGVDRVGQMPGLLPLHHVHVGSRIIKPAVGAGLLQGPLAVGAPEVGMAHVVVVGDRHGRPITEHVAELQAELDPADGVLRVAVGLVAGEKEEIGIEDLQVCHQLVPRARCARRVAGEHRHAEPLFLGGIAADSAGELGGVAVPHAVGHRHGGIPAGDAEVGVPARIKHRGPGHLFPAAAAIHLEAGLHRLSRLEGKELRGELERRRSARRFHVDGVDRKGDDVRPRHVDREGPGGLGSSPAVTRHGTSVGPPVAGGPAVEQRKLAAKRSWIERGRHGRMAVFRRPGGLRRSAGHRHDDGGR